MKKKFSKKGVKRRDILRVDRRVFLRCFLSLKRTSEFGMIIIWLYESR